MVRCDVFRRWRLNHGKELVEERLYVRAPTGEIWRSEWRRTGYPFYILWRSGLWVGVEKIEPDARLVGRYKVPLKGTDTKARREEGRYADQSY